MMRAACCVGPAHYYMGVIDVLQEWTWAKRAERSVKSAVGVVYGWDVAGISAVPPEQYKGRFQLRVQDIIVHPNTPEFAAVAISRRLEPPSALALGTYKAEPDSLV